ncbi:MAG TPA: pyrroloquinoline quinone biosynthesis peptide chaperone PqqD [Chthoniobacteraceae bacterium]|nr:pyrroloquinoline quinone biosynthesis peptide chaperone PqqD [Chthoniobacteraceae bacterium]
MQNTDIDPQARPSLAPSARLQTDPVDNTPVLLYPEGVLRLNETAREILSRCDGRATVAEIIAALEKEYDAGPDALRADVIECLAQFQGRQLVIFAA